MNELRVVKGEVGGTGRARSIFWQQNLATDEYLSALTWPADVAIYNKMERSDAQVKATLLMLELPIRSTNWYIKPADSSAQAKKIADFVEEALFTGPPKGLSINFDDFIKEACTMFTYGHAVFEKVFEVKKGYLKWRKFAPRPQSTIWDWQYDRYGTLTGIEQYLVADDYSTIPIPAEKLLIFSHDMKQGDFRGRSVLRTAYKHWSIKDFLYKITNIGIERNLVGTPVIRLPANYTPEDLALAQEIVKNLRSHEYGGVTLPDGFLLELFEGSRTLMDVLPFIENQDLLISRNILAQFMNLGKSGGAFALSKDQSSMYMMMLNSMGKYIANCINAYAIPQLVDYNFASDLYPKLLFRTLGDTKLFDTVKSLTDGNLILPDTDLEEWLREMLELPAKGTVTEPYEVKDKTSSSNNTQKLLEVKSKSEDSKTATSLGKDQKTEKKVKTSQPVKKTSTVKQVNGKLQI